MHTLQRIKNFIIPPRLSSEVFEAFYFKIPDVIDVSWKRDGEMIVGKVKAGDKEFYTQGKDPDEFVEMVNDSIYTVFEVPFDYIEAMSKSKPFRPTEEELTQLYNGKIPESFLSMNKNRNVQIAQ